MVSRISPIPNRPMTATRKSKPRRSSVEPKVRRSWPVTESRPTAASAKPSIMAERILAGGSRPMPMKLQKVRNCTAKNSAGPKRKRQLGEVGGEEGDQQHGHEGAHERGGEGRRQRLAGPALLRHRIAVEGGRHRPGLARDVEQDRGDRPAEQRPPVDAGEHDDGGGRRHAEGERQEDRHAVRTAQARQHADQHAQEDADQHVEDVHRVGEHAEPVDQRGEGFQRAVLRMLGNLGGRRVRLRSPAPPRADPWAAASGTRARRR